MKREGFNVLNKPGQRDKQSIECVTGTIEVADDVFLGKKLFAAQLGSMHAHARVVSVDASAALALDGVEAVMDHTEIPGWSEEKFFVGDGVAVVAATSQNIAMRALELINVEYEVRPAVVDPEEAMASGAPLVGLWPEGNTNDRTELIREGGDLDTGFAEADVDIEVDLGYTNNHSNHPLEGGNCTAWWNGGDLYCWMSTQNPHSEHRGIAGAFGLPYNKVRIFTHGNGAGFGSGRAAVRVQAAALARKTGKVVSFHIDRKEQFQTGPKQFPTKSHTRIGAKNDGTITALDFTYWSNQGMNSRAPMTGTHQCWQHAIDCMNVRFKGIGIATNTVPRSYYRCVAHPGGAFHMNLALNKLADELGMDPCELRLKNFMEPDHDAMDSAPRPYAVNTLKQRFQEVMDIMDWDNKSHANGENNVMADGRLHGIAITGHQDGHGGMGSGRAAIVHLRGDGTGFINAGLSRTGCGSVSAHCHIVAERLGLHYDDISVGSYGDTGVSQEGG
jgi:CO/xanthine dehydrogenase Mo-binding subunit